MKQLDAVELFSGIGGFRVATDQLEIQTVWANDIDPMACAVYRGHFGGAAISEGDIHQKVEGIPPHDLLTAGFPCQPFSSAGKKQGIEDPRGTLFQVVVDVLQRRKPRYFVLENVKRLLEMEHGWHFATILNSLSSLQGVQYKIEWRLLNATNFGLAQNRQRVFITGVRLDSSEIVESAFDGRIRLATEADLSSMDPMDRSRLLSPENWLPLDKYGSTMPTWGVCFNRSFFGADLPDFSEKQSPILLAEVMEESVDPRFDFTDRTLTWLHKNTEVNRFVDGVEILSNQAGGARMGYTIFGTNGVAPTLTSTASRHYERYKVGNRYRRLTNVEYARLQGFPDDYCRLVSIYDQYALFGNAVPPPMAAWVIKQVRGPGNRVLSEGTQISMALTF